MRIALACIVLAAGLSASEQEAFELDPSREEDRTCLLEMVSAGDRGANVAARKLAKAGHVGALLEILETTTVYNAMLAVTAAAGARSIPIMERRLEGDPDNPYLVGSLRPRTDSRVTRLTVRALRSPNRRTVDAAAAKLIWSVEVDGLRAEIQRRFHGATREWLRAALAFGLLRRGDATPVAWVGERLRAASPVVLDRFVDVANWNTPFPFDDGSVLELLLPDLVALLESERPNTRRDARQVLRRLTRHDFGDEAKAWRIWHQQHGDRALVYTRAADDAIRKCAEAFRDAVHALDRNYLCATDDGPWDGRDGFVWRVENPRAMAPAGGWNWPDGSPVEAPRFRIQLRFSLQTNAWELEGRCLEQRFDRINVVVRLRLGEGGTAEQRAAVVAAARRACEGLVRYQKALR